MACLVDVDEAEFGFVAQTVEINAPTCSKPVSYTHLTLPTIYSV